jgi:hypothetical protein
MFLEMARKLTGHAPAKKAKGSLLKEVGRRLIG